MISTGVSDDVTRILVERHGGQANPQRWPQVSSDEICLSNSIKYSEPGKQVLLAARVLKTGVRIEVLDQGIGIPSDQIEKAFDEFYRVPGGAALSSDRVGLGLSLVARLARTLKSEVRLNSILGQGTRCSIRLGNLDPRAAI